MELFFESFGYSLHLTHILVDFETTKLASPISMDPWNHNCFFQFFPICPHTFKNPWKIRTTSTKKNYYGAYKTRLRVVAFSRMLPLLRLGRLTLLLIFLSLCAAKVGTLLEL